MNERQLIEKADNGYELWALGSGEYPFVVKHMNAAYFADQFKTLKEAQEKWSRWQALPGLIVRNTVL